jgi:hypothetical protein
MWVYRQGEDGRWLVGYFFPDHTWFTESSFDATDKGKELAAQRVHYLNGGK